MENNRYFSPEFLIPPMSPFFPVLGSIDPADTTSEKQQEVLRKLEGVTHENHLPGMIKS